MDLNVFACIDSIENNVKTLSIGLELFKKQIEIQVSEKESKFLSKLIQKTGISKGSSHQLLKSWVALI